jgi:hypothetical protein
MVTREMSLLVTLLHGSLLSASFDWTPVLELVFAVAIAGIALIIIYSKRSS